MAAPRSLTRALMPLAAAVLAAPLLGGLTATPATSAEPSGPSDPAYTARDLRNIADAYARITDGQLGNPAYLPALAQKIGTLSTAQLLAQAATPTRLAITPGNLVPGWNAGNPLRDGWEGTRGEVQPVAFTNRYGALLRGKVWTPLADARDPYTGKRLRAPYPGVVITTGSVQGSQGMYEWLAQDLAERGYVVLTYDVQGQGTSETLPHVGGPTDAVPFCNPLAAPLPEEMFGCAGVPSQQLANFTVGTRDALSFLLSTPRRPYAGPTSSDAPVQEFNPAWRLLDRRPDPTPNAPGRTTRVAIIGHSLGAGAVSRVQATDRRVSTVIALDKLQSEETRPVVPALAVQSEYGFTVSPWFLAGGSSLRPQPSPQGPDPARERATGFDAWRAQGVDSLLVVPRGSTHLEYTDIPLALPASRYGQALTSVYIQRWLDHYLRDAAGVRPLLARSFRYLEPVGAGRWAPVRLRRDPLLSFYHCSAYALTDQRGTRRTDGDVTGVGCRD